MQLDDQILEEKADVADMPPLAVPAALSVAEAVAPQTEQAPVSDDAGFVLSLGAFEGPILSVAQSEYQDATPLELRRELDYLYDRQLVTLDKQPSGRWHAVLTGIGVDLAEYTIPCESGIARPAKYW